MHSTEAWVLIRGGASREGQPGELRRQIISFSNLQSTEVLAQPLYGSWEGNMTHALQRQPVDICRMRREGWIVLGNSGVVRILQTGAAVSNLRAGDLCILVPIGRTDPWGYATKIFGYDAPGTLGLLAKEIKLDASQVIPIPSNSRHRLEQWAAFSVRYATAWANWKIAYGCYRLQMSERYCPSPWVWGWGGGVAFGELTLALRFGCRAAMIASHPDRIEMIRSAGIIAIDRREFPDLDFDEERFKSDTEYKRRYLKSEKRFLEIVRDHTQGIGASIFLDNIGKPIFRATLRALARQGVVSTVGWKHGMELSVSRAAECIGQHIHVHTHASSREEGERAIRFAEEHSWLPPVSGRVYDWDEIPQLASDFESGRVASYFPMFRVNAP